jgi:hypothetical protein
MNLQILAPGAVLALWTMIIMLWMATARFGAFAKAGIDVSKAPPGLRGGDVEDKLPASVNWKAHNYHHLLEQPTIFYPVVFILALAGTTTIDIWLAWAYVGLRIAHSLWQTMVNRIPVRSALFFISSICLLILAVRAVMATLLANGSAAL